MCKMSVFTKPICFLYWVSPDTAHGPSQLSGLQPSPQVQQDHSQEEEAEDYAEAYEGEALDAPKVTPRFRLGVLLHPRRHDLQDREV